MRSLINHVRCKLGWHRSLDVINSFGSAQHVGCPDCGRQFGIHHGMRAVIPWNEDMASMYRAFGHDVDGPLKQWKAYRARRAPLPTPPEQEG